MIVGGGVFEQQRALYLQDQRTHRAGVDAGPMTSKWWKKRNSVAEVLTTSLELNPFLS